MNITYLSESYSDERGTITDLLTEPLTSVTRITTLKGAVRGNHYHEHTAQWTYVLSGRLIISNGDGLVDLRPGRIAHHPPGDPHAWKAVEDTDCLVFTRGPRSGDNYEADTYRFTEPLL